MVIINKSFFFGAPCTKYIIKFCPHELKSSAIVLFENMISILKNYIYVPYPNNREKYLIEKWIDISNHLLAFGLKIEIDRKIKVIKISSNTKIFDCFIFIKSVKYIKLITRGVPLAIAKISLLPLYSCFIIKLSMYKIKAKVLHKNGELIHVLENLSSCAIIPYGKTVSVVGQYGKLNKIFKYFTTKSSFNLQFRAYKNVRSSLRLV